MILGEKQTGGILLVLLKLSVTFDTIKHGNSSELLKEAEPEGYCAPLVPVLLEGKNWILEEKTCSTTWELTSSEPETSILSFILFNIYMKLLGKKSELQGHMLERGGNQTNLIQA